MLPVWVLTRDTPKILQLSPSKCGYPQQKGLPDRPALAPPYIVWRMGRPTLCCAGIHILGGSAPLPGVDTKKVSKWP